MIAYQKYNKGSRRTSIVKKKPAKKSVGRGRTVDSRANILARKQAYSKRAGKDLFGLAKKNSEPTWTKQKGDAIFDNLDADDISSADGSEQPVSNTHILKYLASLLGDEYQVEWGEWNETPPPPNAWKRHMKWVKKYRPETYAEEDRFYKVALDLGKKLKKARLDATGDFSELVVRHISAHYENFKRLFWQQVLAFYS